MLTQISEIISGKDIKYPQEQRCLSSYNQLVMGLKETSIYTTITKMNTMPNISCTINRIKKSMIEENDPLLPCTTIMNITSTKVPRTSSISTANIKIKSTT
jgi:hypothetical protein